MSTQEDMTVDGVIRSLIAFDPIKVWSWLTTIFGDMAREPGSELSGSVLGVLTEAVGIRPQAMRVALHRLRKDGWIVARKKGRTSHYRLTDAALTETIAASARIYAAEIAVPSQWHLIVAQPARDALTLSGEYLKITESTYLGLGPRPPDCSGVLALDVARADIPDWVLRGALSDELDAMYRRFAEALSAVEDALQDAPDMTVLQRVTLRLLILHHWRRVVLRSAPIVDALGGAEGIGGACRARSAKIFDRLPAVSADRILAGVE